MIITQEMITLLINRTLFKWYQNTAHAKKLDYIHKAFEKKKQQHFVPCLQAQRAFRQRLQAMELKASQKEIRKQENLMASEKLSLKEKKQQQKKIQRQQVSLYLSFSSRASVSCCGAVNFLSL